VSTDPDGDISASRRNGIGPSRDVVPARSRLFRKAHLTIANRNDSLPGDGIRIGGDAVRDSAISLPLRR
jgi:hypothetical protein